MADIEKVIKGLECCKDPMITGIKCNICPYWDDNNPDEYQTSCNDNLCADALELLKEQKNRIDVLRSEVKRLDVDIVRCKDCKHYTLQPGKWECDLYEWAHEPDWFCHDGERE